MIPQRWLRIIPVAPVMSTISYVDRPNVSLALDPKISSLMHDLLMDDRLNGPAAGIFFLGYVRLQLAGGHFASRWSGRKLISLCLIFWGVFAIGCGLAESGVYPATLLPPGHAATLTQRPLLEDSSTAARTR